MFPSPTDLACKAYHEFVAVTEAQLKPSRNRNDGLTFDQWEDVKTTVDARAGHCVVRIYNLHSVHGKGAAMLGSIGKSYLIDGWAIESGKTKRSYGTQGVGIPGAQLITFSVTLRWKYAWWQKAWAVFVYVLMHALRLALIALFVFLFYLWYQRGWGNPMGLFFEIMQRATNATTPTPPPRAVVHTPPASPFVDDFPK